ncbi:MAG: NADH-quinone oxidoreductase subunit N [Gemmataceae bacterium]|nr:NADH-quinone oxidoreductase subunit N [Gemmataceae bacterium]
MTDAQAQALVHVFPLLLPEILLTGLACLVFLGGTVRNGRHVWAVVALGGLSAALAAVVVGRSAGQLSGELNVAPVLFDGLTTLGRGLGIAGGIVFVCLSWCDIDDSRAADWHACLLIVVAGLGLVAAANDLVMLFTALEMVSLPTYVMLYLARAGDEGKEAAVKYFLLSVFSSALLLFGMSYLYGLSGTTNLTQILRLQGNLGAAQETPALAAAALVAVVAGLGFRVTAAPFHFYAPDVYQGTSHSAAAFLAWVPKLAGFLALLRLFGYVLPPGVSPRDLLGAGLSDQTPILFWFVAVITMTWGNLLALLQENLKRLLAYSSIAHAGYLLMPLATAPYLRQQQAAIDGIDALLYYLAAYGAMTVGLFAVLSVVRDGGRPVETIDDLAGLSRGHPLLALTAALLLFSLVGLPLTAGFTGKFLIFFGAIAVQAEHAYLFTVLAVIGMVNAAIGAWYYLRLVAVMYLRQALAPPVPLRNVAALLAIAACAALTVALAVPPGSTWYLHLVRRVTLAASG